MNRKRQGRVKRSAKLKKKKRSSTEFFVTITEPMEMGDDQLGVHNIDVDGDGDGDNDKQNVRKNTREVNVSSAVHFILV